MPRYIDADALYEKTAELEASAYATIEKLKRTLLEKMDENKRAEWLRWTAILGERIAFKHDVFDAPTADVVERKVGKWIEPTRDGCITYDKYAYAECSSCGKKSYLWWSMSYCPNCGAQMDERREDE